MARLFVAADLPGEVRRALSVLSVLSVAGVRVPAESLHITLCFLGEVDELQLPTIGDVVCAVRVTEPVVVSVDELLWLPPRRPRVCAVGLVDGSGALRKLQASLSSGLTAGGWYEPERRPFLAHVTVARLGGEGAAPWPPAVAAPGMPPIGGASGLEPFAVPSVTLYRSRPGAGAPRYEPLASVALAV